MGMIVLLMFLELFPLSTLQAYVIIISFDLNTPLRSIVEVPQYILQNHHLSKIRLKLLDEEGRPKGEKRKLLLNLKVVVRFKIQKE